jgi:hypothetical protein
MKHSLDYSFVNSVHTTMAPHSFYQSSAALATHSLYHHRPLFASSSGHAHQEAYSAPYLLQDHSARNSDFQSNSWYTPGAGPLMETRDNHGLTYPNRPLLGLGISFNTAKDSNFASQNQHSKPPAPSASAIEGVPSPGYLFDVEMTTHESFHGAYSHCPGEDFIMQTRPVHSMPALSDSLTDEFLMLVDSSPTFSESKMEIDSPAYPNKESMYLSQMLVSPDPSTVGIIPDVNFRSIAASAQVNPPILCVNPADLTGPCPIAPPLVKVEDVDIAMTKTFLHDNRVATSSSAETSFNFPREAPLVTHSALQYPFKRPEASAGLVTAPKLLEDVSAWSIDRTPLSAFDTNGRYYDSSLGAYSELSPILDVHLGVELRDVRRKADAWRKLNPGYELDKEFLQVFAGKLSTEGEETSIFRCYVKGCSQTNKRKDHILVHVGSHVEHRPFKCDSWYVPSSVDNNLYY